MLVTDAMAVTGTDLASFELHGRTIYRKDGRLTTADGTLAGSDLDMAGAVRNSVERLGLALPDVLRMASLIPAQFLRLDHELRTHRAGLSRRPRCSSTTACRSGRLGSAETATERGAVDGRRTGSRGRARQYGPVPRPRLQPDRRLRDRGSLHAQHRHHAAAGRVAGCTALHRFRRGSRGHEAGCGVHQHLVRHACAVCDPRHKAARMSLSKSRSPIR